MIKIYNFSHPLSAEAQTDIAKTFGQQINVINVSVQIDPTLPILPQIAKILYDAGIEADPPGFYERIYIIPPGLSPAALAIARILANYYVKIIRLRSEGTPPKWVLAEIFDL